MFNRKYKKGIADAAKAYEAFGQKQSDALTHILKEVREGKRSLKEALNSLKGNVDSLYEHLLSEEKQKLYTVYTPFDIKGLGVEEQHFLLGALLCLSKDNTPSENQQNYLRAIQRYLEIKDLPFGVDPLAVENIENTRFQKAIFQVVIEFLQLQEGDCFDQTQLQQDFLEAFNLNEKTKQEIMDHVSMLYMATGAVGLAEKYGFDPSQFSGAVAEKGPSREVLEKEWAILEEVMENQMQSIHVFQYLAYDDPDYEMSGDGFYSKSDAMNAGEQELRKLYNAKLEIFNAYSGSSIAVRAADHISTQVISVFDVVRKQIREFGKNTACMKVAQQMEDVLNFDALMEVITKRLKEELQKNSFKYKIEDFSYYRNRIEVDSDDLELETGLKRVFEKMAVKWDYMICDGSTELDDDANRKQKEFASSATEIINRELRDIFAKMHAIYSGILE